MENSFICRIVPVAYQVQKKKKTELLGVVSLCGQAAAALPPDSGHQLQGTCRSQKATKAKAAGARAANTVQAICEKYLAAKDGGGKLRTADDRKTTFERLVYPAIGDVPIGDLRRSQIVTLLDKIQDGSGDRMADLTLAYLRKVFNWHAGRVDDFNCPIVKGMGRYKAKSKRGTRILTDDEIGRYGRRPSRPAKPFHALVRFLLLTGAAATKRGRCHGLKSTAAIWKLPAAETRQRSTCPAIEQGGAARAGRAAAYRRRPFCLHNDGHRPLSLSKPKRDLKRRAARGWRCTICAARRGH